VKAKLTQTLVNTYKLPEGKTYDQIWDVSLPGLYVYVGGRAKTYKVWFQTKTGETGHHKLGRADRLSLEEARTEARKFLAEIDKGNRPDEAIKVIRGEEALSVALPEWLEKYDIRDSTRRTWGSVISKHILPHLGTRKPGAINKGDILAMYRAVEKISGRQANQSIIILRTFYNRTTDGRYNPASEFRNDKSIKKHRESERQVVLTLEQVRALLEDCDKSPQQQTADAVRLLLLTGARIMEILSLRWEYVNFSLNSLTIPHTGTKEKKSKTIFLSDRAREILEKRFSERQDGQEWVFPGRWGKGHQTVIKAYWAAACRRCGITGVHVHDLRATYSTFLIKSGETNKAVGQTMGHASPNTTARYERIAENRSQDIAKKVDDIF
jgi:integrase